MIRRCLAAGLVRLAAFEERFADLFDDAAPRDVYPADHPAHAMKERAARLRTSALDLRRAAIKILIGRPARWT